jgi:hypothetical protein
MHLTILLGVGVALAQQVVTELDFETVNAIGERHDPLTLAREPLPPEAGACADLLALGLTELPSVEGLGTRAGQRQLDAAARSVGLDPGERDHLLANARTCFAWRFGDRPASTIGLYGWFVREAGVQYCREQLTGYHGLGPEDLMGRTPHDDPTAILAYCTVDPWARPLRRDPYERVQTALSEAHIGRFIPGGAARGLYRHVASRLGDDDLSARLFLSVLREIDASGAPAAAFVVGETDRVWRPRELEGEAADRLARAPVR